VSLTELALDIPGLGLPTGGTCNDRLDNWRDHGTHEAPQCSLTDQRALARAASENRQLASIDCDGEHRHGFSVRPNV
jgi:hypothetical protein